MSNVHIAKAAHEVASALPSTATVTVSKHGIAAIETLNLEAQTASQTHLMWSRTFSGMEIVTNPVLHYMVETVISNTGTPVNLSASQAKTGLKQVARLTSDPIANAASNISVTVNNAELTITPDKEWRIVNTTYPDEADVANQRQHYGLNQLDQYADPYARSFGDQGIDDVERQHNTNALRENYPKRIYVSQETTPTTWHLLEESLASGNCDNVRHVKIIWDVYQPLAHPYFRDNAMRDNTLVNLRYFDCQIYLDASKLVEVASPRTYVLTSVIHTWMRNASTNATTQLFLSDQLQGNTAGIKPTLIFDLITPAVPLPTISEKPLKLLHTMTSTHRDSSLNMDQVRSGNIQLSQVPDMIYVFLRSSKMDDTVTKHVNQVPTRLGVCTNLRVRTPQNAAFLLNMDQETLYQMSVRNGSKQSRSAFMCSLGSVICIDPEKDLGGYTNGVLAPFTFEVVGDFSLPCGSNGSKSRLWFSDLVMNSNTLLPAAPASPDPPNDYSTIPSQALQANETFTLYVVCELHGHLYLMSDGSGKQTKSNLTVSEVAEAVGHGVHHPSTFPPGRVQKMDSGVLAEVANASADVGDDVRAALRD